MKSNKKNFSNEEAAVSCSPHLSRATVRVRGGLRAAAPRIHVRGVVRRGYLGAPRGLEAAARAERRGEVNVLRTAKAETLGRRTDGGTHTTQTPGNREYILRTNYFT